MNPYPFVSLNHFTFPVRIMDGPPRGGWFASEIPQGEKPCQSTAPNIRIFKPVPRKRTCGFSPPVWTDTGLRRHAPGVPCRHCCGTGSTRSRGRRRPLLPRRLPMCVVSAFEVIDIDHDPGAFIPAVEPRKDARQPFPEGLLVQ